MDHRRILFVCSGNICRSPLAEGILRRMSQGKGLGQFIEVDSAGTGGWHVGEAPDPRSIRVAERHGIDLKSLKARKVKSRDFHEFDMIFAMDRGHLRELVRATPHDSSADLHLFMDFVSGQQRDIPDPYYGDENDFEAVYDMLEDGCARLIAILSGKR